MINKVGRPRYQLWSRKLVCGFMLKKHGSTLSINTLLPWLKEPSLLNIPTSLLPTEKVNLEDVTVVIKKLIVSDEYTVNDINDPAYTPPNKKAYSGSLGGGIAYRSWFMTNQYPLWKRDNDYIWFPLSKVSDRTVEDMSVYYNVPTVLYDIEFLCGCLEDNINNTPASSKQQRRTQIVLGMIKDTLIQHHPDWQYKQFDSYFNGVAIYQP